MKFSSPFLLLSFLALTSASPIFDTQVINREAAPLLSSVSASAKEIPNSYIVVFKDNVSSKAADKHRTWVTAKHHTSLKKRGFLSDFADSIFEPVGLKHTFDLPNFLGYAGSFDEDTLEDIRKHPDVAYVEKDSIVHTLEDATTQSPAPWGLARISHREALGFGTFNKYIHQASGGDGVDVYVIDTGTNVDHVDFEGRATWGKTIPQGDEDEDGNGHGTHCAGTVGGAQYGVSKKAKIIAIKVLRSNGSGTMSDVVKGVEYAAKAHLKRVQEGDKKFKGSAANMSLGGGKSATLDRAVDAAVNAGLHFAVAAGNDNADACNYSPAASKNAVTVGASTLSDTRAYFSNWGKCVDIFAPGLNIKSTWIGSKHATNTISGTSMASPHIAGLLAYYLSLAPAKDSEFAVSELTPEKLKKHLIAVASKGLLDDIPSDTPNLLAWNGGGSDDLSAIFNGDAEKAPSKKINGSAQARIEKVVQHISEETEALLEDLEKDIVAMLKGVRKSLH